MRMITFLLGFLKFLSAYIVTMHVALQPMAGVLRRVKLVNGRPIYRNEKN